MVVVCIALFRSFVQPYCPFRKFVLLSTDFLLFLVFLFLVDGDDGDNDDNDDGYSNDDEKSA